MTTRSAAIGLLLVTITPYLVFAAPPNVVMVITDDQGYGDLSCTGNPVLKTPNIDQLYSESVRLTDYHVAPTCSPTRAALQTGHWTNRTGVWHTIMGRSMLRENEVTMGQVFKDSGYATGMFGKWHLGDNYPFRPEDRGYTEVMRHGGGGVGQTPDVWDNAYFDGAYYHNSKVEPVKGFCTDVFFDYAKRFIKAQASEGKPFFAYIATNAPHGPMHAPERFSEPYKNVGGKKGNVGLANFYGMIANIDDNVGQLRDMLEKEGLAEDTIFIFTTDNGTSSGDKIYNANMRGKKGSAYDGGHRVPFMVHWPVAGLTKPRDVDPITAQIDVLPTLIDLCGLESPEGVTFDGRSLRSLISPKPTNPSGTSDRDETEPFDWDNRILVTDSQRVKDPIKWRASSVMTSRWRLIDGKELYDIDADPGQQKNIAKDNPDQVSRLREFYDGWWADLLPSFSNDAAIIVGHPAENPARLTSHDWITTKMTPWNQSHIRGAMAGPENTGFWNLQVDSAGTYEIRLRRWPQRSDTAIDASLPPGAPVPGSTAFRCTPGKAVAVNRATIKIGEVEAEQDVAAGSKEVTFQVELPAGKTRLHTLFLTADGHEIGAYYATVFKAGEPGN